MELKLKEKSKRNFLCGLVKSDPTSCDTTGYTDELINGNILVYCGTNKNFNESLFSVLKSNDLIIDKYQKTTTFWNNTNETTEYYYESKPEILNYLN